jgi:CHAT domain-containing protein
VIDAPDTMDVDLAPLVRGAGDRVRAMERAEAARRLFALAERASDPIASFLLEADAARLGDPPFAEPYHWAAFHVTGEPIVRFAGVA